MTTLGEKDTAFVLQKGATLRNVIIGKTAGEGVYCLGGGCNIEFVWFEDVCEDAVSIVSPRPVLFARYESLSHLNPLEERQGR